MRVAETKWHDSRIRLWQIIFLLAIIQFIVAFFTDPMVFTFDESMWQYIGRNWIRNGLVPYQGGVDNKSPLIFLIYGIPDKLFGISYWFPRLFGITVQSLGILYLYKISVKTINRRAGIYSICIYGLALCWHSTGGKYVSYTETYAVTAIIMSVYFSMICQENKSAFIGGLWAGLGFGFRITAIFGMLPLFIFVLKRNRKSGILFLLGALTSVLLLILFARSAGIQLHNLVFYGILDNFGAGSTTDHPLAWKIQQFAAGFFYSEIILFYPAVLGYFMLVKKMDFWKGWLICELAGILFIGTFDRSHFKNLLPVISFISAYMVNYLTENYPLPPKKIMLGIWLMFFPKTFEPLFAMKKLFNSKNSIQTSEMTPASLDDEYSKKLVGLWIRDHTLPTDKVYVAGYGAQIQLYSERISPSIYFNVTQTLPAKKRLFQDLVANQPDLLVIPVFEKYFNTVDADVRLFIQQRVNKNYILDTGIYNYNIFKFKKPIGP